MTKIFFTFFFFTLNFRFGDIKVNKIPTSKEDKIFTLKIEIIFFFVRFRIAKIKWNQIKKQAKEEKIDEVGFVWTEVIVNFWLYSGNGFRSQSIELRMQLSSTKWLEECFHLFSFFFTLFIGLATCFFKALDEYQTPTAVNLLLEYYCKFFWRFLTVAYHRSPSSWLVEPYAVLSCVKNSFKSNTKNTLTVSCMINKFYSLETL